MRLFSHVTVIFTVIQNELLATNNQDGFSIILRNTLCSRCESTVNHIESTFDQRHDLESTTAKRHGIESLVGSVQYTCPVVPLCIVDASLSHYPGN